MQLLYLLYLVSLWIAHNYYQLHLTFDTHKALTLGARGYACHISPGAVCNNSEFPFCLDGNSHRTHPSLGNGELLSTLV